MICPDCGNEIRRDEECPICSAQDVAVELATTFCTGCGNDYFGEECPDCSVRDEPAVTVEEPEPDPEQVWDEQRERERLSLCPDCGHGYDPDGECEVCAVVTLQDGEGLSTHFCSGCGNEVYGSGDCPICGAGRAPTKPKALTLCKGCGNEVEDVHACPICQDGRAIVSAKHEDRGAVCPQCDETLEPQMWDGVEVLMCMSCQGCLFGPEDLEHTLDKLRETAETSDLNTLIREFREQLHGVLPKNVRYKPCPVCGLSMTRRNYKRVSGIIIEVCGRHGTWVDQATFGQLTDWVTRGGDAYAARKRL